MAKVKVKIPEIRLRKQEIEVPPSRAEQVKQVLSSQQERLTQMLSQRNAEVSKQLDKATSPSLASRVAGAFGRSSSQPEEQSTSLGTRVAGAVGRVASQAQGAASTSSAAAAGRFSGILRLSRTNPEAAQQLDQAAAAAAKGSNGGSSNRFLLLGLGALVGAGVGAAAGVLGSPTSGKQARTVAAQQGGRAARTASKQAASTARTLSSQARNRAAAFRAARSSIAQERSEVVDENTISARVETELGENPTLRHLPRINVNTEPGGVVYLRGPVPSENERQLAEEIARRQRGVNEVVNELHVQGTDAVQ